MKVKQYKSLGLNFNFNVPETVEEFDTNAKKAGACLTEAINNVAYRGGHAVFRDLVLHGRKDEKDANGNALPNIVGIEELTGIDRKTREVTSKDGKTTTTVFDESEGDYFKRVCAEKNVKPESFQPLADEVSAQVVFDASATERTPAGPKTASKKYIEAAQRVIANGNGAAWATKLSSILGRVVENTEASLALAIRDDSARREREALAQLS